MPRTKKHPTTDTKVWDKAKWHFEGEFPKELEERDARRHILFILKWLQKKGLTSAEGDLESDDASGYDTALNSDMVTDDGREFLDKYYDRWLKTEVAYNKTRYSPALLNKFWRELSAKRPSSVASGERQIPPFLKSLHQKARRGNVEVEDLLALVAKGSKATIPLLERLKNQYSWPETQRRSSVPLGAWAK